MRALSNGFMFFQSIKPIEGRELGPEILTGIMMGVAFAAPPGAVTAETFRRGVRGGFSTALGVQLGSLVGDAAYAVLALVGLATLVQNRALELAVGGFGALFLIYLAWSSFQMARARTAAGPILSSDAAPLAEANKRDRGNAFLSGMALSLTNPWAIAFWLSLGGALASIGVANASVTQTAIFFSSFMLGSTLWAVILSFTIGRVRRWMRPAFSRAISAACGLALFAFGMLAASRVISALVGI